MTTSTPNIVPPAGGGDPDPDSGNETPGAGPDSLLAGQLEGSGQPSEDPDSPEPMADPSDPDIAGDSVENDKRRTGAE